MSGSELPAIKDKAETEKSRGFFFTETGRTLITALIAPICIGVFTVLLNSNDNSEKNREAAVTEITNLLPAIENKQGTGSILALDEIADIKASLDSDKSEERAFLQNVKNDAPDDSVKAAAASMLLTLDNAAPPEGDENVPAGTDAASQPSPAGVSAPPLPTVNAVYIQVYGSRLSTQAAQLRSYLLNSGIITPAVDDVCKRNLKPGNTDLNIRYFHTGDAGAANALAANIKARVVTFTSSQNTNVTTTNLPQYETKTSPGIFEIWMPSEKDDCNGQ
jgi:hypothetical protein